MVQQDADQLSRSADVQALLEAIPSLLLILNRQRQVVCANTPVRRMLGAGDLSPLLGRRPGEVLRCEHAGDHADSCGFSAACRLCGAARAIAASEVGVAAVHECRIAQRGAANALDLRVSASPLSFDGRSFTVLTLTDISHEKRRKALERIFFHDLLNTVNSMIGCAQVMSVARADEQDLLRKTMIRLGFALADEVRAQRELLAAECNELAVHRARLNSDEVVRDLADHYASHDLASGRQIRILPGPQYEFSGDPTLLMRVLGNMVKNALEATPTGQTVTIGCQGDDDQIHFTVHNPGHMSLDVQLQVFQRSFSTKGAGRGLGTYSMKLLTERYLKGRVSFESTPESGTTFRASYPKDLG